MVDESFVPVSPLDALRIATRSAADLIDLTCENRVAEGGFANYLLVDRDPPMDIDRIAKRENNRFQVKRSRTLLATTITLGNTPTLAFAEF